MKTTLLENINHFLISDSVQENALVSLKLIGTPAEKSSFIISLSVN